MPACQECLLLTQFAYSLDSFPVHYYRRARQLKSNSENCRICRYLYDHLPGSDEDDERSNGALRRLLFSGIGAHKDMIHYGCVLAEFPDHPGHYRLQLGYFDNTDRPISPEMYGQGVSFVMSPVDAIQPFLGTYETLPSTGDAHTLDQGEEWLQTCLTNHRLCQAYTQYVQTLSRDGWFQPKRLIEILPTRTRLHDTRQGAYRYVALSHRWPLDQETLIRLTTANIEEFRKFIPDHEGSGFSRVFADAINVCRHLGISYIWIDSLCIIQEGDSGSDWKQESVRMSEIYQNAICTISADSIEETQLSVSNGMFVDRDIHAIMPIYCNTKFNQKVLSSAGPLTSRVQAFKSKKPKPGSYILMPEIEWKNISSSPLFRRGWIMQERLLSQRILHFGKDELHFTCCETQASETWPMGHPIFQISKPFRVVRILQETVLCESGYLDLESQDVMRKRALSHPYGTWYWIAHFYAGTTLTRPQDKLVAISGLAKALQPHLSDTPNEYYAGIWRGSLPHALMWGVSLRSRKDLQLIRFQDNHRIGSEEWRAAYQAPSWSWASVNWVVTIAGPPVHDGTNKVLAEIVEIDVRPIQDQFGQVEPGSSITFRGHLYKVSIIWRISASNVAPAPKFWAEVRVGKGLFAKSWVEFVMPDERYIEGVTEDTEVRAFPALGSGPTSQIQWMELLLLTPLQDGTFTRFGYLRLYGKQGFEFLDAAKKNTYGRREPGQTEIIKII